MTNQEMIDILRGLVWDAAIDTSEKQELDSYLNKLEKEEKEGSNDEI